MLPEDRFEIGFITFSRLPTGCGEQRLITFVPTIVATKYLASINKLTKHQKEISSKFLRTGYNQMLERKNPDGSFNLWSYEKSDSIWLSAYVLKCLGYAKHLISINDLHIYAVLNFLKSKQEASGSFSEYGPISHKRIQGGVSYGVPLTAFVVISILENPDYVKNYHETVNRSLSYIDNHLTNITDNYAVAISAYAFVLGKHSSAKDFLKHLERNAIVTEDKMHWQKSLSDIGSETDANLSHEIELAAYALLAFLKFNETSTDYINIALSIRNWLISKRNSEGGFYSTQDTVIGLQALAEYSQKFYYLSDTNMKIKIGYGADEKEISVNKYNSLTVQHFSCSSKPRDFKINAKGTGIALLNLWYTFNRRETVRMKVYKLVPKVISSRDGGIFYLTICVSSLPEEEQITKSNMALLEITLPSGYVYDSESTLLLKEFNVKVRSKLF